MIETKKDLRLALKWKARMGMTPAEQVEFKNIYQRLQQRMRRWKPANKAALRIKSCKAARIASHMSAQELRDALAPLYELQRQSN